MDELYKRLNEILRENTELKHTIVDLQSALRSKEQEVLMLKGSAKSNSAGSVGPDEQENECIRNSTSAVEAGSRDELRQYLGMIRKYVTGLTGYKMEFRDGEIVFHSLYAFDSEDVFIFRYRSGNMELVNNEFAGSWANEIQNYLISGKSIPAFLAAVTLELFNKKTFG